MGSYALLICLQSDRGRDLRRHWRGWVYREGVAPPRPERTNLADGRCA